MSFIFQQIGLFLQSIWTVWSLVWWIVIPVIAAIIYFELKKHHDHIKFHHSISWKLLEITVPKEIMKTPKAMEQIFAAAYLEGERHWMSFEIVGRAGETHFYLRVPQQFQNMMEAAIYAQYSDAEIAEVDDYLSQMPREMPNAEFDIYGVEQTLGNPEYFPIRTYASFEDSVDERRIDTIALLTESMAKLKDAEQMWLQIVIAPAGDAWKKEGEHAINKILGIDDKHKKKGGFFSSLGLQMSLSDIILAPFVHPGTEVKKHEEAKPEKSGGSDSKEVVSGIRTKIAKLGFETTVRFCYLDRRASLVKDNISSMSAFFRQFNDQRLNYFKPDPSTATAGIKGWFAGRRLAYRKRKFYEDYALVHPHHHNNCILNIEELATLYHFPIGTVGTVELRKVTSRKAGPPATLPLME